LFVLVLLLGFVFGAWSVAAVWRIGVIVAVAIMIIERIRAMRRRSGIS
jgi:hypothetical protein